MGLHLGVKKLPNPGSLQFRNVPTMQETLVRFLGQEDPLENREATHSSILGLPWWLRW